MDWDSRVRQRAFEFLDRQIALNGGDGVLPRELLLNGLEIDGKRIHLMSPAQGIFKPRHLSIPISICTAPPKPGRPAPYADRIDDDKFIHYRYRGTDPSHPDNVGLRQAWRSQTPLIYLFGVMPGQYLAMYPVFIHQDDPATLTFVVAVDDRRIAASTEQPLVAEGRRAYLTSITLVRLHQASFRHRVLQAYRARCAVCRLSHTELLDAAHIVPDCDPMGRPSVTNGLALCKLHHAAFDRHFLGIRPDLTVELRRDVLEEVDGPMLTHGLQEFHQKKLLVVPDSPNLKPGAEFLEERYRRFKESAA